MNLNREHSAFPLFIPEGEKTSLENTQGMYLLDYFAAKAIQAPVNYRPASLRQWVKWLFGKTYTGSSRPANENAKKAYELAAAMLEERKNYI